MFTNIKNYINSNNPWIVRVGIVLLLDYYINTNYIDKIFNICDQINSDNYYVKMAIAWLLSMCLVKYYDKTIDYLKVCKLDNWTYNKTIQKAIESYQITNKDYLRSLKKKLLR